MYWRDEPNEITLPVNPLKPLSEANPLGKSYISRIPNQFRFGLISGSDNVTVAVKTSMILGRRSSVNDYDVTVDFTRLNARRLGVSRFHAMILCINNQVTIKDLKSLNGTLLNGQQLKPDEEYPLNSGDTITLGKLSLNVRFVDLLA